MPGLKIGGKIINNLRYADDTALIAENQKDLQILLNVVKNESRKKRFGPEQQENRSDGYQQEDNSRMQHFC